MVSQAQQEQIYYPKTYRIAAPSLAILPDARGAGLGNIGVATSADAAAVYHNLSKTVFSPNTWSASANYTPWMSQLVNDMGVAYLGGYYKWGSNRFIHAVGASFRYFSIGKVSAFPGEGKAPIEIYPNEWALDAGYAIKLLPQLGAGLTLRYAHINMNYSGVENNATASAFMADLSLTYREILPFKGKDIVLQAGMAIKNIGNKVSFDNGKTYSFLPASFNIGVGAQYTITDQWDIQLSTEVNKLMAPTLPPQNLKAYQSELNRYYQMSAIGGVFASWNDSANGFQEELQELSPAIGAEITYDKMLTGRLGWRYNNPAINPGSGFYSGLGLTFNQWQLDLSYYISSNAYDALDKTFRISAAIQF